MSQDKSKLLRAGHVAGGALVALSGVVPQPFTHTSDYINNQAHAATAKIGVTAKLVSGITIGAIVGLDFGTFIATKTAGNYGFKADANDSLLSNVEGKKVAASTRGKINIKARVAADLDIKFSKVGTDATATNTVPGTFKLDKIIWGDQLNTAGGTKTATAAGTTIQFLNYAITKVNVAKDVSLGADVAWSGGRPIGTISNGNGGNIVVTITY